MRGEVEYYDSYLRGEAYGFELYKDGELEDSCWGFIGNNEEGRVAESNFCGTPLLQTNQEKNGGIASKSNQPKPKNV